MNNFSNLPLKLEGLYLWFDCISVIIGIGLVRLLIGWLMNTGVRMLCGGLLEEGWTPIPP